MFFSFFNTRETSETNRQSNKKISNNNKKLADFFFYSSPKKHELRMPDRQSVENSVRKKDSQPERHSN